MSWQDLVETIEKEKIEFVDLRFTDLPGKEHHVTIPASAVDEDLFTYGKGIDGSSLKGWQDINQSDLALVPCPSNTAFIDPFYRHKTLLVRAKVIEPVSKENYDLDPREIARRAEHFLAQTGIADKVLFGPEPEFFIFDDVQWDNQMGSVFYKIQSSEAHWKSGESIEGGNTGHRPGIGGGYFPVPPVDSSQDLRSSIALCLQNMGIVVETHHHEVAGANQCEVATKCNTLVQKADEMQLLKYVIQNVAHQYGKTATFMPKPMVGDNGSGMHCHQSLLQGGENLFNGHEYAGLSSMALHYIGGILHHAKALNALTNPTINSYRRLVPGFEAPVYLGYGYRNRSAAVRIPYTTSSQARRIEVRFPDCTANPYLAFAAMLMAGLDGIKRQLDPGQAFEQDLYHLNAEEKRRIPRLSSSLEEAIQSLEADYEFLLDGGVFTQGFVNQWMTMLEEDVQLLRQAVHPLEFALYYSR
jgi:glutamine synthetase